MPILRNPRSRNLDEKPVAKEKLLRNKKCFALCTMVIEYLESLYIGNPLCGWNNNNDCHYGFGSRGIGKVSVFPRTNGDGFAEVRIRDDHKNIPKIYKDNLTTHGPAVKGNPRIEMTTFKIFSKNDLENLNDFIRIMEYVQFSKPNKQYWEEFSIKIGSNKDEIERHYRKAIEEGFSEQREKSLQGLFAKWLTNNNIQHILREKNLSNNGGDGTFDLSFKTECKKTILTELKFTNSTKTDIDNSLGQLFRYKLYGEGYKCDEIWTVSGSSPKEKDLKWIDEIRENIKPEYRLAYLNENDGFTIYPNINL